MFARFSAVVVLALPVFAAASAIPRQTSQCNTGEANCCNSVQDASNPTQQLATLFGLLGVVAGSATGQAGVTCTPITGIGASGTSCSQQPVCCTNNSFNGVIALGCTPINVNV